MKMKIRKHSVKEYLGYFKKTKTEQLAKINKVLEILNEQMPRSENYEISIFDEQFKDAGLKIYDVWNILDDLSSFRFAIFDEEPKKANDLIIVSIPFFPGEVYYENFFNLWDAVKTSLKEKGQDISSTIFEDNKNQSLIMTQKNIQLGNKIYAPRSNHPEEKVLQAMVGQNKSKKRKGKYNFSLPLKYIQGQTGLDQSEVKKAITSIRTSLRHRGMNNLTLSIRGEVLRIIEI